MIRIRINDPGAQLGFSKGGGVGGHTVSHIGYLHGPLQMFGPENGVTT